MKELLENSGPSSNMRVVVLSCVLALAASAFGVEPPPPSGPPEPLMVGIDISGSTTIAAGSEAQYVCIASFSDNTSQALPNAVWGVVGAIASMEAGLLSTAIVRSNQTATLTASYSGFGDTLEVLVYYTTPPPVEYGWELTMVWVPEVGSTNETFLFRTEIPFEHDTGFVSVRQRKVEVRQ